MAATGILLRRLNLKQDFTGDNSLVDGELVFALNDNEFGFLKDGNNVDDITWGRLENELPTGGNTGDVLTKSANNDYDVEWETPSGGGSSWTTFEVSMNSGNNWTPVFFTNTLTANETYIMEVSYVSSFTGDTNLGGSDYLMGNNTSTDNNTLQSSTEMYIIGQPLGSGVKEFRIGLGSDSAPGFYTGDDGKLKGHFRYTKLSTI